MSAFLPFADKNQHKAVIFKNLTAGAAADHTRGYIYILDRFLFSPPP